jgi:hypothetical protein
MKLYTEEQVISMFEVCRDTDLYEHILTFEDILKTQTPIALPSDEEISEESMDLYGKLSASITDVLQYKAFKRGAKWVLNKIQGEYNS